MEDMTEWTHLARDLESFGYASDAHKILAIPGNTPEGTMVFALLHSSETTPNSVLNGLNQSDKDRIPMIARLHGFKVFGDTQGRHLIDGGSVHYRYRDESWKKKAVSLAFFPYETLTQLVTLLKADMATVSSTHALVPEGEVAKYLSFSEECILELEDYIEDTDGYPFKMMDFCLLIQRLDRERVRLNNFVSKAGPLPRSTTELKALLNTLLLLFPSRMLYAYVR